MFGPSFSLPPVETIFADSSSLRGFNEAQIKLTEGLAKLWLDDDATGTFPCEETLEKGWGRSELKWN